MGNKASLKFQRLPTQPLFSFTENNLKKTKISSELSSLVENVFLIKEENGWTGLKWKCYGVEIGAGWNPHTRAVRVSLNWKTTKLHSNREMGRSFLLRRERCLIGGDRNWSKHYLWKAKSEASRQIFNQSYSCDISMLLLKLYSLRSGTLSLSGQLDRERSAVL